MLQAGRFGDQIPVGGRFFLPIKIGPENHPALFAMGTGSLLSVKWLRRGTPQPHTSSSEVANGLELYLASPLCLLRLVKG